MRDYKRIERILTKLSSIWTKYPDMRLGQMIENVTRNDHVKDKVKCNLFNIEDEDMEKYIDIFIEKYIDKK